MSKKPTSKLFRSDLKRLSKMREDEIDLTEIPEISPEKFAEAAVRNGLGSPRPKAQLTLRVDRDVLEWFRGQGRGYQTRINTLLRAYMEASKRAES